MIPALVEVGRNIKGAVGETKVTCLTLAGNVFSFLIVFIFLTTTVKDRKISKRLFIKKEVR